MKNLWLILGFVAALACLTTCASAMEPGPITCGLLTVNGDGHSYPLPGYSGPNGSLFPQPVSEAVAAGNLISVPIPEGKTTLELIQTIILSFFAWIIHRRRVQVVEQ